MPITEAIAELLRRPAESLNVEVKAWIDPRTDDGVGKIVKGVFAIRNRNGGYLIIGFNNSTLAPDPSPFGEDVTRIFHLDTIQGLISRYASRPFEISIEFHVVAGQMYPVIIVPEGVTVPVMVKSDLVRLEGGYHLRERDVYFRTLNSNGTPSSSLLGHRDQEDLMNICFDNREADIGRFLRRHLGSGDFSPLTQFLSNLGPAPEADLASRASRLLERGEAAFQMALSRRPSVDTNSGILDFLTMRVAMVLYPPSDAQPTQEFMNKIAAGNPQFTGWPVWLDSRGFTNPDERAHVRDGAWEAFISADEIVTKHFEFMLLDPKGEFYLRRVMQDDLAEKVTPRTVMDVVLMIYRVTEVLAVGISISRAAGWDEDARARFTFRWSGLENRKLHPWVNVLRSVGLGGNFKSVATTAESSVELSLDTPHSALAPYVSQAVAPLFAAFNGYQASDALIESCVRKVLERRMSDD